MMDISIFTTYAHGAHPPQVNYERTRKLIVALGHVHPLFSAIGPQAAVSGIRHLIDQPLFETIDFDAWCKIYDAFDLRGPPDEFPDGGVLIGYWNRVLDECSQSIDVDYDVTYNHQKNSIMLTRLCPELRRDEVMLDIIRACVDSFDIHRAEIAHYTAREEMPFLFYRLWTRADTPFPEGFRRPVGTSLYVGKPDRYTFGHPSPSQAEPWLGGTLYTWPEHSPALLAAAG